MKHKILIVDPVPIVRYGLIQLIKMENDLVVCGEAVDAPQAVQLVQELKPDLVITDITIEHLNGVEIIRQLKAINRDLPILVYTLHDEYLYGERSFRAGAKGYVKKVDPPEVVRNAIRKVLTGYLYLSDEMARTLFDRKYKETSDVTESESPIDLLSNRELEIFELISKGFKPAQMAEKLNISVKTVENYRVHIRKNSTCKAFRNSSSTPWNGTAATATWPAGRHQNPPRRPRPGRKRLRLHRNRRPLRQLRKWIPR
ncbi:MAG TPA: response regulator transcription factor [bacterium]|mgnify:CR=1 FL=1|nr:response regulator transcription factor [bacterium]